MMERRKMLEAKEEEGGDAVLRVAGMGYENAKGVLFFSKNWDSRDLKIAKLD